ncbi:lytic polysaccharide monooxygenase [Aquimarina aggregata]|uniref:lytic polysaccharide monooxygenase n=1 Tax=Aquimarina aggregata TaxID=1642818 RepID=UPI00249062F6|nr:lytic polysaccharide monooxygenase [Aquimarina aggregata]
MKKTELTNKTQLGIIVPFKRWLTHILVCVTFLLAPIQSIFTHGTVTNPPSRVWICFQEDPQSPDSPACEASIIGWGTQAFYDWNEVARMDAGGRHREIIADGNLASAGRPDKYGGLDQVRNDWVTTQVTPGPYTVTWTNTAPHQTLYYDVYITKADWTPDQPLTWDSLELLTRTGPRPASATDNIDVVLPQRTGKHVIYSIWQRSLTPEAFYSTSDVDFGTTSLPNQPPVAKFITDNGRCGGPDVTFDASDSSDPNGDTLTYTWDFGDGTTAQGVNVSHTYASLDSATVTLTVSDGEFSSGSVETISLVVDPNCEEIPCPFDTPLQTALPSINASFSNVYVLGGGGPDLSTVTDFTINWDAINNGLYQLSINTNNGIPNWWNNLLESATYTFNAANPEITLTGTGFAGLDGTYAVTIDNGNFVMVSQTEGFTIYFSTSSTAPDCEGVTTPPTNSAPVASFIASALTGTDPFEVSFDASGSTDADGDPLTFNIDYGDGTFGREPISTHTYSAGEYTATLTISDGKGGAATASVSLVVDGDIVVNPPSGDCAFETPLSAPLETIFTSFNNVHVLGTGGPNMESVTKFTVNWDLANNGLYQFSFDLNVAPWYINFSENVQSFNEANPGISITGSGITGLDGDYFAAIDNGNFVLVADGYSIYFSNTETAPICDPKVSTVKDDQISFKMFPNPAVEKISILNQTSLKDNLITISDLTGKKIKSQLVKESTNTVTIDVSGIETGLYLVRILDPSGSSRTLNLLVN